MLSPETYLFSAPRVTRFVLRQTGAADVATALSDLPYHNIISVVCSDEYQLPDVLLKAVTFDSEFYKLNSCSVCELICEDFIKGFINTGSVSCLSINNDCTISNCIAICNDSVLIIHVVDKLYEELGIDGVKTSEKSYKISIDLRSNHLKSQKYGQKLKIGFAKLGVFDLLLKWKPNVDNVCPSSIAKYFHQRKIKVTQHAVGVKTMKKNFKRIPRLQNVETEELVEWVGMVAIEGDIHPAESYISTYMDPTDLEDDDLVSHAAVLVARGFFTLEDVMNLYNEIVKYNSNCEESQWIAMSCQSFTDTPCNHHNSIQFQAIDAVCTVFVNSMGNNIHKTVLKIK